MYKVATAAIFIQTRGVQSVFSLEKASLGTLTPEKMHWKSSFLLAGPLTENSLVSGASLKNAENFYGYFDTFGHPKLFL